MNYKKINKTNARKAFNHGTVIYMLPCKVSTGNMWLAPMKIDNKPNDDGEVKDFDKVVNEYEYYNCQYNELGKYCAFYVEDK